MEETLEPVYDSISLDLAGISEENQGTSLAQAAAERKQAERDAQTLANRIKLLQAEEQRAQRKINETRKRVSDCEAARERQEKDTKEKQQYRIAQAKREAEAKQLAKDQRLQRQANRRRSQAMDYERKRNIATAQRTSSAAIHRSKATEVKSALLQNKIKAHTVRKSQEFGSQKVAEYQQNRIDKNREDYHNRIQREEWVKQQKEQELLEMERIEAELIAKLQNTQQKQKNVYDELDQALNKQRQKPLQARN